jgi:hypothetical protein
VTADPPWASWAPPLDPPTAGGLNADEAERIAAAWWADDPHRAAALMWESYAATLDPEPSVASVTTGAQSVVYSGGGGGAFGKASARAAWHWQRCASAGSVPVALTTALPEGPPPNWLGEADDW